MLLFSSLIYSPIIDSRNNYFHEQENKLDGSKFQMKEKRYSPLTLWMLLLSTSQRYKKQ